MPLDLSQSVRQSLLREIAALSRDPGEGFDVVIADEAINGGLVFEANAIELADHDTLNHPGWGIAPVPSHTGFTLLLTKDAKVIGQLSLTLDRFGLCIEGVAVDFRYRGKEHSEKLVEACVGIFSRAVRDLPDEEDATWLLAQEVWGDFNDAGEYFALRLAQHFEEALRRLDAAGPEI